MSRKAKIALACTVIITILAITLGALWLTKVIGVDSTPETTTTQSAPKPSDDMPAMTHEQTEVFAANLVSQDTVSYRAAWAVDGELPPPAPVGTTVVVNLNTFAVTGDAATVNATITLPDKAPALCRLLMLYTTDNWRLVAMEEVK